MKKEIADKWVSALRSGKYRQSKNVLKRRNKIGDDSYCCLGVLCEVTGQEDNPIYLSLLSHYQCGIASINYDSQYALAKMNDIEFKTFNQIADYIEQNWESL